VWVLYLLDSLFDHTVIFLLVAFEKKISHLKQDVGLLKLFVFPLNINLTSNYMV